MLSESFVGLHSCDFRLDGSKKERYQAIQMLRVGRVAVERSSLSSEKELPMNDPACGASRGQRAVKMIAL